MTSDAPPVASFDDDPASGGFAGELDLRDYLTILRRHRLLVAFVFLGVIAAAAAFTLLRAPTYEARAEVLVRTWDNQSLFPLGSTDRQLLIREPEVELQFTESGSFTDAAADASDTPGTVSVSAPEDTGLLVFTATSTDQETVAELANAWATTYTAIRHQLAVTETASAKAIVEDSIAFVDAERDLVLADIAPIDTIIQNSSDPDLISRLTTQRLVLVQSLQTQLTPLENELYTLNQELSSLRIDERFLADPEISSRVVTDATRPSGPTGAGLTRNLVLAAVVGAILAVAAALLRNSLDASIKGPGDLSAAATSLPVLASIPRYRADATTIEVIQRPTSTASESFRTLLTSLELSARHGPLGAVLITSAQSGEGKSTVALNLAALATQHSDRVVLVDGDLRRPRVHRALGIGNDLGLTDYLADRAAFDEIGDTVSIEGRPLAVITAGQAQVEPAELLRGWRADELFDKLRSTFELMIVDAPPTLPVTDAVILARQVDAMILVARANETDAGDVRESVSRLRATDARLVGAVLNADRDEDRYSYYYRS